MRSLVTLLIISTLALGGCSYLPKFGGNNPKATPDGVGAENPLVPERENLLSFRKKEKPYTGTLIDQLSAVEMKTVSGGKMLLVRGYSLRQGAFEVRLVNENEDGVPVNGVLTYSFRAYQPNNTPQGIQNTRLIDAAIFLSRSDLEGVSTIRVVADRNEQTLRP